MKVHPDTLCYLAAHCKYRIEGSQRILKDHGNLISPDLIELLFRHGKKIFIVKEDRAVNDSSALS